MLSQYIQISEAETTAAINSILPYLDETLYTEDPIDLAAYHQNECIAEKADVEKKQFERYHLEHNKWICLAVKENGEICNKTIKGKSSGNIKKHSKTHLKKKKKFTVQSEKSRMRSLNYYRKKELKRQVEANKLVIRDPAVVE